MEKSHITNTLRRIRNAWRFWFFGFCVYGVIVECCGNVAHSLTGRYRINTLNCFCPKMSLPDRQLLTLIRLSALTFIVGFRRSQPQPTVINLTPGCSGFS